MHKIIHLDMDAFFASIEQRDNPALCNLPIVVGGDPDGRGVVATASYEARRFGIRSAMSCRMARSLCPDVIFVRPRFDVYKAVSRQIHGIMQRLTDTIEPLGLDEAYLDVTYQPYHHGSATLMANWLRQEIFEQTGLTASAGVSFNKMLAKIASDINKPNGIATITPDDAPAFIDALPIEKIFGIGRASAKKLHAQGVRTGYELKQLSLHQLTALFGKRGQFYYDIIHLNDSRAVKSRTRQSIGSEITLVQDLSDYHTIIDAINKQACRAFDLLQKQQKHACTITLKLKYHDFSQITRSLSLRHGFACLEDCLVVVAKLFTQTKQHKPVRLVGVSFSNFVENRQLCLLDFDTPTNQLNPTLV